MVNWGGGDIAGGRAVYLSLLRWKIGAVGCVRVGVVAGWRVRSIGRRGKCVLAEGATLPTGIFR